MKRIKLFAVLGLFLITAILTALPAYAQNTSNGFLVSPVREELTIDKGRSETVTLTVENATAAQVTAKAIVNDFEPSADESGQPKILLDGSAVKGGNSFKELVAPIPNFTLAPRERKEVKVTITVPSDASAGGYYGAVRFANDSSGQDNNVALAASVGTIFLVEVPGDLKEELNFVEFTAMQNDKSGRFFVGTGKMSILTRLQNTGNIHVKPYGKIQVKDRSGKVVEEFEFNSTEPRANVLPGSTRKFVNDLKKEYGFGKYTISANLGYTDGGALISATNTFWVVPLWIIIACVVLIVALIVGGFLIFRKMSGPSKHKVKSRR